MSPLRPAPSLAASSRPPCCSTIDRLIVRPRPSPSDRRTSGPLPCSNSPKIRGSTSGAMPMPVSLTVMITGGPASSDGPPPPSREPTVIVPPSGVNLIAFLSRFQRTCWSRIGSASTS